MLDIANSRQHLYLGLDVGGTNIKAGLVTRSGIVLSADTVASHAGSTREQVLADIDLALSPFHSKSVIGLGAGFPSFGDYERGVLDSELSAYPSMHRFPLRHHLENTYGIPAKLVPDTNLLAYGLLRFGEGRRFDSFMAIGLGTGTAVSLVRCGEVLTGPRGFPAAIMRFYTGLGVAGLLETLGSPLRRSLRYRPQDCLQPSICRRTGRLGYLEAGRRGAWRDDYPAGFGN